MIQNPVYLAQVEEDYLQPVADHIYYLQKQQDVLIPLRMVQQDHFHLSNHTKTKQDIWEITQETNTSRTETGYHLQIVVQRAFLTTIMG